MLLFCPSLRADDIDQQIEAKANGEVVIVNHRGKVDLIGWDRHEVSVVGELDDLTENFIFERDGDRVRILVKMKRLQPWGDGSDLTIHVPAASQLRFRGVSTDLSIRDVSGGAHIRNVSGDVRGRGLGNRVRISTVSGDIDVERSDLSRMDCKTVSGRVQIDVAVRDLKIGSVSGDVDLELGLFESLRGETVSGSVDVRGRLDDGGVIEMLTVSGDLDLRLDPSLDAEIYARTGPGGDIENDLTETPPRKVFPAQHKLKTTSGQGNGRVHLGTVHGTIRIRPL
jgi:DUF4097 and DUF4098 domain-containing protein YvlB